jgi:uncharacterized protein with HEPN domain
MEDRINKCFYDIKVSIEAIQSYVKDNTIEIYAENRMLKSAVEREFLIIGEAMNRICKMNPDIKISSKVEIIGMRNRIVHGYDMIRDITVWDTIEEHLPKLKQEVIKLLQQN